MIFSCLFVAILGAAAASPYNTGGGGVRNTDLPYDCGHTSYDCVPYIKCDEHRNIKTDGGGQLDLRTGGPPKSGDCYLPNEPEGTIALCCLIPGYDIGQPQDNCYGQDFCEEYGQCPGGPGDYDASPCWAQSGKIGVCCPPQHLDQCPGQNSVCVEASQCIGTALNDHVTDNWLPYSASGTWDTCSLGTGYPEGGVCCIEYLNTCPGHDSVCVEASQCAGYALHDHSIDSWLPYTGSGHWDTCSLGTGYPDGGVCCVKPLNTCDRDSYCVSENLCKGEALNMGNVYNSYTPSPQKPWRECYISDYENGVCCKAPYILEFCPGDISGYTPACVPFENCAGGEVMDYSNNFSPYQVDYNQQQLAQCLLDQYDNYGICCEPGKIIPPAGQCGVRNSEEPAINERITSHPALNEARFGEFPWQAIIFDRDYTFISGATLVSNRYLLTAAHNIYTYEPYQLRIRLGEWQVNTFDEPIPYIDVDVSSFTIHPAFDADNAHNDLAIIELAEPIDFSYHINAICLPEQGHAYVPVPDTPCITSGWGKDSFKGTYQHILKRIHLPFVDHYTCQDLLRLTRLGKYFKLDESFVCAGGEENEDACKGDGGGPLACLNPVTYNYDLVGITAWGIGCGQLDVPGVYVNVALYTGWINDIINAGSIGGNTGYGGK